MGITIAFAVFAMMVFVLIDIILIDETQIRNLGRIKWILVAVFLPLIGSLFWLTMGRIYAKPAWATPFRFFSRRETPPPSEPVVTDVELARLDAEIACHQQKEKILELEAELRRRRKLL
ncbi:membrane protein [Leifsonia rubra CMS 76R]|nr:membrane protein [Leifsonia rubra CMS 76R]